MKKSDLKDGMIVELRNGDMCIVVGDKLLDTDDFTYIDGYNDDLTDDGGTHNEFDIVRVYKDKKMCCLEDRYKISKLELIWERKDDIDWSKVEFGTKVRVWDKEDSKKLEGVFLEYKPQYKNFPFRAYVKDEEYQGYISWQNCELV